MKQLLIIFILCGAIACGDGTGHTTTTDSVNVTTETDTINASGIKADTNSVDTLRQEP